MSESIFVSDGDGLLRPTEHARGPWDPGALHGGAPAALIASRMESFQPGEDLAIARMSFSFLRPVPMAPLALSVTLARPGRRVQELEARLTAGSDVVCVARALRIQQTPRELPELANQRVREEQPPPLPGPQKTEPIRFALDDSDGKSFAASAMEMRFLSGRPLKSQPAELEQVGPKNPLGHARVWMRLRHPLLVGEPTSSLARLVAAADFGNGVSAVLPFSDYIFINADLAITLDRRPQGEWIALDSSTLLHGEGVGWARSVLYDESGPVGLATQALVVQAR